MCQRHLFLRVNAGYLAGSGKVGACGYREGLDGPPLVCLGYAESARNPCAWCAWVPAFGRRRGTCQRLRQYHVPHYHVTASRLALIKMWHMFG